MRAPVGTELQQSDLEGLTRFGSVVNMKDYEERHGLVEEGRESCQATSLEVVKLKTATASEKNCHNLKGV